MTIKKSTSVARSGLSLVEILIAMAMTLIILGAMMSAFSYGSAEMQKGRASIELNNRLISAEEQLRRDLDRITVELKPYHSLPTLPKGFVEIVDGPETDYDPRYDATFTHGGNELLFGDRDDYFGCTIKSDGKAFRGRNGNNTVESHLAEVAWFTIDTPNVPNVPGSAPGRMVCRRQLLILPSLGVLLTAPSAIEINDFFAQNDISARLDPNTGDLVANSLADLAIRRNRYCHLFAATPQLSQLDTDLLRYRTHDDFIRDTTLQPHRSRRSNRNHSMFSSVAAFDIQVFDPEASVRVITNAAATDVLDIAEPSDIGANKAGFLVGAPVTGIGAYVDLWRGAGTFGVTPTIRPTDSLPAPPVPNNTYFERLFDTGTSQYDRDDNGSIDIGSNGIDDDGDGFIDESDIDFNGDGFIDQSDRFELGEKVAVAPYNAPIRGLKFTMRVLEPNTKQVRQLSVTKSFVTE